MKNKIILLFIAAAFAFMVSGCSGGVTGGAVGGDDYVSISMSDLSTKAQFYTYTHNGVDINYFVVLGSDGEPRTAFDACDVCGGYKGYRQIGTDIECRNCGRVFSIDGLGTKNKGYGCWPSYLPHEQNGDELLIKISDIIGGRKRFA